MKKKSETPKKIDITSLKVIKKENLNTLYGGSAPAIFTSFFDDSDSGTNCSIALDIDNPR
jgi:hypothetical protein